VGAVIGELVAEWYGDATGYADLEQQRNAETDPIKRQALSEELAAQKKLIIGISELAAVGGTAVLLQSGAEQLQLAKMTANNAAANNFLNHTQQNAFADELNACKTEAACQAVRVKYQAQSDANNKALAQAQAQCDSTGNCAERDRLYASGMPKLSGGLKQDNVAPDVENAMVLLELQKANAQSIKALINRPLSQEVVHLGAVTSFDAAGNVQIDPARYVSAIDNRNAQNAMAVALVPTLLLPGPEDVAIGAALATKAGQKLAEVIGNGLKVLNGSTARQGSQEALERVDNVDVSGANGGGPVAGAVDDVAVTGRPTARQSEIDVGVDLPPGARPQVSFKNGQEVPYGTSGSVRPDYCLGNVCSVEVKNYNIATNSNGLINNVSQQAIDRAANLPHGMTQKVVIDIRGQTYSPQQLADIRLQIVQRSNGSVSSRNIEFKEK
jgi:hypothetical protein